MTSSKQEQTSTTSAFEKALDESAKAKYTLRLYITGLTPRSTRAIANLNAICEQHLNGRYELEVIDVNQQPEMAQRDQIVAVPTLIKQLPLPMHRIIGDLSDTDRVLVGLRLKMQE